MSIAPDQLGDIYRQISKRFISHPLISVSPSKGDPPNEYLVTYKITGLIKSIDGSVEESSEHSVEFAIPFGFPHFPPSCKPKTDIYHPDFDPGAICVGNIWEQNPSLPDLIVRLGQMINGEFYSTENAFNNDAAAYYTENSASFPLNSLSWDGSAPPEEDMEELLLDTFEEELDIDELEIYTSIDDEVSLGELFPSIEEQADSEESTDVDRYEQYKQRREHFALVKMINGNSEPVPELESLHSESQLEIRKAEALYKEAKELEQRGNATGSLGKYKEVASLVSDFPAIRSDIMRMEQTIDLLEDLSPEAAAGFHQEEDIESVSQSVKKSTGRKRSKKSKKKDKPVTTAPQQKKDESPRIQRSKLPLIATGVILLAIISGAGGAYYLKSSDSKNYTLASSRLDECKIKLDEGKYSRAKKLCDEAIAAAEKILLFKRSDSKITKTSAAQLRVSDSMKFGLAGKQLYDGKYRSTKEIKLLEEVVSLLSQGDSYFAEQQWQDATATYNTALEKVSGEASIESDLFDKLSLKNELSRYQLSYSTAIKQTKKNLWDQVIKELTLTQAIIKNLPRKEQLESTDSVNQLLYLSRFELMLLDGDTALNNGSWDEAILAFSNCIDLSLTTTLVSPEKIKRVERGIAQAELFKIIEKGNKAFRTGQWDDAITAYSEANNKLESQQSIDDTSGTDVNAKRLSKIILRATIIRDKQNIKSLVEKGENKQARDAFNNIVKLINQSPLAEESEFKPLKQEIQQQIVELEKTIYLEDKEAFLESSYQSLFQTYYPDTNSENLSGLQITLENETDATLLFRIQCTEKGTGRPLTLVLHYLFDKESKKWSLTSGE
jgi:ubiquitin-protein ligase